MLLLSVFHEFSKQISTSIQCRLETSFFYAGNLLNESLLFNQFRISRFHHCHNGINHLSQEWILNSQQLAEANRSAENTAKYIASSFIRWKDTIGNHIGNGTVMIGNNL